MANSIIYDRCEGLKVKNMDQQINAQVTLVTPNLSSISSRRYFAIQLLHFIGRGFFALSRIQPFALNDGFFLGVSSGFV
jgi:hypothetical protein